jgi:diguanylate cyclase (GGDEF)-like protein
MDASAFPDFQTAATAVLAFLQERLRFDLWMVTRTVGDDWVVLHAADRAYGVTSGDVFKWSDAFCSRMVVGAGPRFAPRSHEVPSYASAAIGYRMSIGAYIGVPLTRADGSLFGTLCAIARDEQSDEILAEQPLVELLARLLSMVLESELEAADIERRAQQLEALAMLDDLTSLPNRRAWDIALAGEEKRCERFAAPAAVVSIDLDGLKRANDTQGHEAGDALLRRAAKALLSASRAHDTAARTGGDEFALLAPGCAVDDVAALVSRLAEAFARADVDASFGTAVRRAGGGGLEAVWRAADADMYLSKARRRASAAATRGLAPA